MPSRVLLAFLLGSLVYGAAGCGSGVEPQVGPDAQGHIRDLGRQFMQYQSRNAGKTPPNEAAFKKFLGAKADEALVSPRDKVPYIVRYGLAPKMAAGESTGDIVLYEKVGVAGKRFVVTSMANVQELTEAELKKAVPDAK